MNPQGPFSNRGDRGAPSSRGPQSSSPSSSLGSRSRVQRDVRLQAGLALLAGTLLFGLAVAMVRQTQKKNAAAIASASASASLSAEQSALPTVSYGDAGSSVTVDAGGRSVTFGEPHYVSCQDPGPTKTPPEKCDRLGAVEELVTKTIAERAASCLPAIATTQAIDLLVDVSFKRHKIGLRASSEGSTMPAAQRDKAVKCFSHGLQLASWDGVAHGHQHYKFRALATFSPSAASGGWPGSATP